jgi:hypothetical protein
MNGRRNNISQDGWESKPKWSKRCAKFRGSVKHCSEHYSRPYRRVRNESNWWGAPSPETGTNEHSIEVARDERVKPVGLYSRYVLPHLIDLTMRNKDAARLRAAWIPQARGEVLEIGVGSGLNLPFYSSEVHDVHGVDPSPVVLGIFTINLGGCLYRFAHAFSAESVISPLLAIAFILVAPYSSIFCAGRRIPRDPLECVSICSRCCPTPSVPESLNLA